MAGLTISMFAAQVGGYGNLGGLCAALPGPEVRAVALGAKEIQ